jgi:putative ABC transport system permease protein
LIAKFSARADEVASRRALGAPRRAIFFQHLLEAELVSCGGAVLGLLLALGGISMLNTLIIERPVDFSLDTRRVLLATSSAVLAGLVAGLYPAWRICNTQPATVLRRQ